jgi:hypothetical protein
MPDMQAADAANRMYWESDASVADIASRFDLSRRALYEVVRPLPSGARCDVCGEELVFENRLGRKGGTAVCESCGATREGIEVDAMAAAGAGEARRDDGRFPSDREDSRGGELRQRAVLLSGAAIAGIAIGGVATWLARRR